MHLGLCVDTFFNLKKLFLKNLEVRYFFIELKLRSQISPVRNRIGIL